MSDENTDLGGPSFSPEEDAYFESGGQSELPTPAPEPEEAATTEPDTPEPKVEKMVALSTLHAERATRKARDADLRARDLEIAELRGKFSIIDRLNPPAATEQVREPTVDEDIFSVVKKQGETLAQFQKRDADRAAQTKADNERNTIVNDYKADAAAFQQTNPDFKAAYDHLLKSRAEELREMGYDDPHQLHNALIADELAIARMARSQKKSAASIIYNLSLKRGYAKAAPVNRGQAANKSPSDTGGEMTGERLMALPMDEFEEWTNKNPAKAKRLMGGK